MKRHSKVYEAKQNARWAAIRNELAVPKYWKPDCSAIAKKIKLPMSTVWDQWKKNETTIRDEMFGEER